MVYLPDRVEVKRNEQIRFMFRRTAGELATRIRACEHGDNLKHAALMQRYPDMEHDDPNGKTLQPKAELRDSLAVHQARAVRIWLPDPGSSGGGNDRHCHCQVNYAKENINEHSQFLVHASGFILGGAAPPWRNAS